MKTFLTEKTRQGKIIEKRNLFGLGLTSLIAACSAAENAAENSATEVDIGKRPETGLTAAELGIASAGDHITSEALRAGEYPSGRSEGVYNLTISIAAAAEAVDADFKMTFRNGNHTTTSIEYSIVARKGLVAADKYDLVVSSGNFGDLDGTKKGALYIIWDIGDGGEMHADVAVSYNVGGVAINHTVPKHLKVAGVDGDIISAVAPAFYHIGGDTATEQVDMVFVSGDVTADIANINILWDVTKYATTDEEGATNLTLGTSAGILQVQGGGVGLDVSFTKINNNDGYDMIVKGGGNTYILWDVAEYQKATDAKAVVNLIGDSAATIKATHGLLKIEGLTGFISTTDIPKEDEEGVENGLTDIDKGGINDISFANGRHTYILFGEKVANRDGEKAISHSIDLTEITEFYDKAGMKIDEGDGGADAIEGFFHFDLDGTGEVKNVGYRFDGEFDLADVTKEYEAVISPPAAGAPALSEEAYWDIA